MTLRFSLLFIFAFTSAQAQNYATDSLNFAKAKWDVQKIAPKTKLKTVHINDSSLFNSNQFISVIELKKPGRKVELNVAGHEKILYTTSAFGKENNAIAAINGTFFDIKNGGSVDFVKGSGKDINQTRLGENGARSAHQKSAVSSSGKGVNIIKWDGTPDWESKLKESDIMVSGPLLIHQDTLQALDQSSFTIARHPRSVVGTKKDGTVLLVTVDGRQSNSAGMSLPELTKLMKWLGSKSAINLDGGGSTTLWIEKGVVNYPSDNKMWDHAGERKVANVILLTKKK